MTTFAVQSTNTQTIEGRLDSAISQAREACNLDSHSPDCAIAWDTVEELQAEISHRREVKPMNNFERYCEENPEAQECRIYDV